jgi:ribosomal protein S18 acetylase RimI-like enzyme
MEKTSKIKSTVEIIEYRRKYASAFRDLNFEWLEKYFTVEPYDRIVLNDPQKHIIDLGGHVLLARLGNEIVGACALIKHDDRMYEISKLAVTEKCQGKGIGRQLAVTALERAKSLGASKVVLATSDLLTPANKLYESLGFQRTDTSAIGPLPYKRATHVMELTLI